MYNKISSFSKEKLGLFDLLFDQIWMVMLSLVHPKKSQGFLRCLSIDLKEKVEYMDILPLVILYHALMQLAPLQADM